MPNFYEHARSVVPPPDATVVLFDLEWRQLLNTRRPFGSALPTRTAVEHGRTDGKRMAPIDAVVSDLFIGQIAKRKDFAIQVPVKMDGTLRYMLTMGVGADAMQALLMRQKLPAGWLATSSTARASWSPAPATRAVCRQADAGGLAQPDASRELITRRQTETMIESRTLDGVEVARVRQHGAGRRMESAAEHTRRANCARRRCAPPPCSAA